MRLLELIKDLTLLGKRNGNSDFEVSGISSDSRCVKAGDVFVACRGPQSDGHLFIREAIQKGAKVVVAEVPPEFAVPEPLVWLFVPDAREALGSVLNRFYHFPSRQLDLIGVTGTNGKTTIAYLLNYLLNHKIRSAYIGTLGVYTSQFKRPLANTTPGSEELFSLLAEMAQDKVRAVALEVSSHALHQKRVNGHQFKLALFTQLTPEHLDYHVSLENYFQAKRLLFHLDPRPEYMLVNQDSSYGRRLLSECPEAKSFSLEGKADYEVHPIEASFEGSEFIFEGPQGKTEFKTQLPFKYNVANAGAALASLDLLGFDPGDFRAALENFPGVPGRLERIEGNGFSVFVDYAHTPDAFENTLSEAKCLRPKRILTLFGCGGDRDRLKRPEMTRIAYHYSDFVILTSDNPRTEDPREILCQMRQGLPSASALPNVLEILDRSEAIDQLLNLAEPGDAVFILGKGHEDYQILGDQKKHFDDREVVRDFLLKRKTRVAL